MPQSARGTAHPPILSGKKAVIVGVANDRSIAWGCAEQMHRVGADIAMTYLNDKARPYVAPPASAVDAVLLLPLDVRDAQVDALFEAIILKWGRLDIEEVGPACVFLASHDAGAMTGDTIYIDGGYHILG